MAVAIGVSVRTVDLPGAPLKRRAGIRRAGHEAEANNLRKEFRDGRRGLILVAALIGVAVPAAGWQTLTGDGSAASVRKEAAAQETRQASAEPGVRPADDAPAATAREGLASQSLAGATQTKRLAVENVLQVGGFGCVSCATVIEGTLQEADGVEKVAYETETDTYRVTVNDDFRMDEVSEQIRSISEDCNRRLGLPDQPDWVLKEV